MKCQNPDCRNDIPAARLKHNSQQKYCSHECAMQVLAHERRRSGFYQRFSRAGNEAQKAFFEQHGRWPIQESAEQSRAEKIAASNHEKPRRGKRLQAGQ